MDRIRIRGGKPLSGEIAIGGAKNAALPILCAAILSAEPLVVENVPRLQDVNTLLRLLAQMGVASERGDLIQNNLPRGDGLARDTEHRLRLQRGVKRGGDLQLDLPTVGADEGVFRKRFLAGHFDEAAAAAKIREQMRRVQADGRVVEGL